MKLAFENSPKTLLERLRDSLLYRDYEEAFCGLLRLPLALQAAGDMGYPHVGHPYEDEFYALLRSTSICSPYDSKYTSRVDDWTSVHFGGFVSSRIPIVVGNVVIAVLATGQVLQRPPDRLTFAPLAPQLDALGATARIPQFEAAYLKARAVPPRNYTLVVRLLCAFAQHLSHICNEIMVSQQNVEPVQVTRARKLIDEMCENEITLSQIAKSVHMSSFYFCKVFKSSSGMTFTEYVARVRVEHAKKILLNPQMRISEAAFAAGFQSLSQFNRVFKRVENRSPSTYRAELSEDGKTLPQKTVPANASLLFASDYIETRFREKPKFSVGDFGLEHDSSSPKFPATPGQWSYFLRRKD